MGQPTLLPNEASRSRTRSSTTWTRCPPSSRRRWRRSGSVTRGRSSAAQHRFLTVRLSACLRPIGGSSARLRTSSPESTPCSVTSAARATSRVGRVCGLRAPGDHRKCAGDSVRSAQFPGRPENRLLIAADASSPWGTVVGRQASAGAIELVDITIDLHEPWTSGPASGPGGHGERRHVAVILAQETPRRSGQGVREEHHCRPTPGSVDTEASSDSRKVGGSTRPWPPSKGL
jgi:hypothetical protein